jgi:hypothetical protein
MVCRVVRAERCFLFSVDACCDVFVVERVGGLTQC